MANLFRLIERSFQSRSNERRILDDFDYDSFDTAANERRGPYPSKAAIETDLRRINRRRYNRLKRDYKWAGKVFKRLGLNPDDVRWLL